MLIGYGPPDQVTPALDDVASGLMSYGVQVPERLRVADGRYWSSACTDPSCCPPSGRPYDGASTLVAAVATFAGQAALPDRETFAQQIAPVSGAARRAMRSATRTAAGRLSAFTSDEVGAAGRTAVDVALSGAGAPLDDDDVAWLGLLLVHVPTRDHAWEHTGAQVWHSAFWADVVRRVEPEYIPAPACLLAYAAWRTGDGVLAAIALERALAVDPQYSMARLLEEILHRGLRRALLDGWLDDRPVRGTRRSRARRRRQIPR